MKMKICRKKMLVKKVKIESKLALWGYFFNTESAKKGYNTIIISLFLLKKIELIFFAADSVKSR